MFKKFFMAEKDAYGEMGKGREVYVNINNIAYIEAASDGETSWIYFCNSERAVNVMGDVKQVVSILEKM